MRRIGVSLLVGAGVLAGCSLGVKNIQPAKPYNFALLDQMAKYAQAAYADDATIRALCSPVYGQVYIQTIATTDNKYFLATSSATHTQLLSIAGTANLQNVLLDADFNQQYIPELKISLHQGFARAARLIFDDVKPRLENGDHILITGHSLGGAEAVIIAMMLKATGHSAEQVVTFGQPKVSNQAGVDAFSDLSLTRVVNENDVIPELPVDPYQHIGSVLVLWTGAKYSLVNARPFDPAAIAAAWQALSHHQAPAELPDHYIANYVANLDSKRSGSTQVDYPTR
jgi:hypothetical protein